MGNFQDCVFHRFHRSRKLIQNTCQQILSKFDVLNSNDKSCSPSCHVYFKVFREPVKKSVENYTIGSDQTLLKQTWSEMAIK